MFSNIACGQLEMITAQLNMYDSVAWMAVQRRMWGKVKAAQFDCNIPT
jgi:hypothetical protein